MRVLVFGTFDGLHPGHRYFLSQAVKRAVPTAKYGRGELFIVVARDGNVQRFKGRPAERSQAQRRREVEREFPQAHVLIGEVNDYFLPVLTVKPDLILLGYDQRLPPGVEERDLREAGIDVERAKPFKPRTYKSSLLRKVSSPPRGGRGSKTRKIRGKRARK
ncbi:MAG: adenylyltransferase/cytidyltransferase family protein [Candidatus Peribacteraceae bacterium]|jgi:FAD synthetase